MAALVAIRAQFPALDKALNTQDIQKSYTTLLLVGDGQLSAIDEHITNLAALFIRHNANKVFGIHLEHGHFKTPGNLKSRWTNVTEIESIDITVYGHIFYFTEDGLCAYGLQQGPLPDLSGVRPEFLTEFWRYIVKSNLTDLIGLQVLGFCERPMLDVVLDQKTVMMGSSVVKNTLPTHIMSWSFKPMDSARQAIQPRSKITLPHPRL
ncbi:hypothetical protein GGR51DRAFT_554367 [Nemania sp. FL0031]|nr:hypothetical protein GGR51DRAFT_554367 [Nemania sp. FL0031]